MGDDTPPAPPPPPAVLEVVALSVAIGACVLVALLAGFLATLALEPPTPSLSPDPVGRLVGGARWAPFQALALALLSRRARREGRARLAGEAMALVLALNLLAIPLQVLPLMLPRGLGGTESSLDPAGVLRFLGASWLDPRHWLLLTARAWGLYLAARARGRPWQGWAWGGPAWLVSTALYGGRTHPAYWAGGLLSLVVTGAALPACVRRADAWLARRAELDGPPTDNPAP